MAELVNPGGFDEDSVDEGHSATGGFVDDPRPVLRDVNACPVEVAPKPVVFFPLNDLGNAARLIHYHGDDLRYCYQAKHWFVWCGTHWVEDKDGEIDRRAEDVTLRIVDEARLAEARDDRDKILKWAAACTTNRKIKDFIERAQSRVPVVIESFDKDPWLLNCRNGTINLRTGELQPHNREDYITRVVPADYAPEAECAMWEYFLYQIMGEQHALIEFLQRAVGYTLAGVTTERVMFILHGAGRNGKTTFLNILSHLLADYAQQMDADTISVKKPGGIPNDIARLRAARFVASSETENNQRLAEAKVKQLTGGDKMLGEYKFQEPFEFWPQFTIWLATNHKPMISGTDHAIWDRIPLIPFGIRFWDADKGETGTPELKVDKALPETLKAELSGILGWAVRGCLAWQKDGLAIPDEVRQATASYRGEMDSLGTFLEECCILGATESCTNPELYKRYRKWAEASLEFVLAQRSFTNYLKERGFTAGRKGSARTWHGLAIITDQGNMEYEQYQDYETGGES